MTFGQRVVGVLRLNGAVFEEIENNRALTGQAAAIVVTAGLVGYYAIGNPFDIINTLHVTVISLVGWFEWALVTYVLGAWLLREPQTRTNLGELLRVIGFSYAPNYFLTLTAVPKLDLVVTVMVAFWQLATTTVAARQALDYKSTPRAIFVVVVGYAIFVAIEWAFS
jgi:hypothetical protein